MSFADLRREYTLRGLSEADVDPDPLRQFRRWLDEAIAAHPIEPTAMSLATADARGYPSVRFVLLKGLDERGVIFYTNYESRKGTELAANPRAAIAIYWAELERQVRAEGTVERVDAALADAYFHSRPLESQLGARASAQSHVLASRDELEQRVAAMRDEFAGREVPRPPFWGGFRLVPEAVEFWQGRPSRLHDRLRYRRDPHGDDWVLERLSP